MPITADMEVREAVANCRLLLAQPTDEVCWPTVSPDRLAELHRIAKSFLKESAMDEDVKPTMTVNMLDKMFKGEDRDKQLIVCVVTYAKKKEYVDITGAKVNEDNLVLGTEHSPAE